MFVARRLTPGLLGGLGMATGGLGMADRTVCGHHNGALEGCMVV